MVVSVSCVDKGQVEGLGVGVGVGREAQFPGLMHGLMDGVVD